MNRNILDTLREAPWTCDFFAAVRRLESAARDRPRIGRSQSPREDPVRFGGNTTLAFPPSTLHALRENGEFPRLLVNFFGLLGPNGPLPEHLTEYIRDRSRNARDGTLEAFLDVFHHRMVSLFYRAWAANQKAADYDRPTESRFGAYFASFLGLGHSSLLNRDTVPDNAKRLFAGRLVSQTRNADGLAAILEEFFGVPAEVETFAGHWLEIPVASRCGLGGPSSSTALGESAILGEAVWDVQTRFQIHLGPMGLARLRDFLPGGRSHRRLGDWVDFYTQGQFTWDVRIVLRREEIPATTLGGGCQLGWTSWLFDTAPERDSGDLVLSHLSRFNPFPS